MQCYDCLGEGHPSFLCHSAKGAGEKGAGPVCGNCRGKAYDAINCASKGGGKYVPKGKGKAKKTEASPISQEEKDGKGAKARAARAMAKAMAKGKATSRTWMIKDGHMLAQEGQIGTGPRARNGALQPRPSQDGPLQQPSGHRQLTFPRHLG